MQKLSIKTIGQKLTVAGNLKAEPLCIYGSKNIPDNAVPTKKFNRCIANAIFKLSIQKDVTTIFIGPDVIEGCCPGGQAWFGYSEFSPITKYFVSTGSTDLKNLSPEYLIASPELAEIRFKSVGKIAPLDKNIIIRKCSDLTEENLEVKAILCFGPSENIRNLCTLAYFNKKSSFDLIQMPMGPSCATFITFPANMAENTPKNCIIIGPTDPTGNYWFPVDYLSMGLPIEIAIQMSNELENSFLSKRPQIAYPQKRINLFNKP
jgi:hypothetical protein